MSEEHTTRSTRRRFRAFPAAARFPHASPGWFQSLIEQSIAGIYVLRGDRFLYVNPRMAELFGYTQEEIRTTKTVEDLVAPEDRERVRENIRRRLEGNLSSVRYCFRGLRKDGSRIELEVHGTRVQIGGAAAVMGLLIDVTERHRTQEELRVQKAWLEQLFQSTPAGIVQLDDEQRVVKANREFLRMFGYSRTEVIGKAIETLIVPDELKDEADALRRNVVEGEQVSVETRCRRKDGSTIHVSLLGAPVRVDGHSVGMFAVYRDITTRKELEAERERLYAEAREAVRARDELLAVVSHDLRNPLNAIVMATDLLLMREQREPEVAEEMLGRIKRLTGSMRVLIQDLLDISSIEAGRLTVDPEATEAANLLQEAMEMLQPLAEEKGVEIELEVERGRIYADRDRVVQVLSNLAGNAVKFTPEGGRVWIRAAFADGEFRVSVQDTGPGIPAEHLPHVFDRFFKAHNGDGAGLGLAIAKGVVEAHGGRIWVESERGRGATFHFTLSVP